VEKDLEVTVIYQEEKSNPPSREKFRLTFILTPGHQAKRIYKTNRLKCNVKGN